MWRPMLAALLFASITACSVTDYKKPVSDFAEATRNAEDALVTLDAEVTEAYTAKLRAQALTQQTVVQKQTANCLQTSERCRLAIVGTDSESEVFPPDSLLGNMVVLMGSIRTYADGLTEIVNADTAEQVATHVNATLGSVENLASTVEKLGGTGAASGVAEYKTSIGRAVNWVVGQYVAKVQVDGLRRATEHAQLVIARAGEIFEGTAALAVEIPKGDLVNKVDEAEETFNENRTESNLDNLVASATDYDRYLLAKPPAVFAGLKEAHDALANKLRDDELSLADVMAKIETFTAEAKTMLAIVREFANSGQN